MCARAHVHVEVKRASRESATRMCSKLSRPSALGLAFNQVWVGRPVPKQSGQSGPAGDSISLMSLVRYEVIPITARAV